jgi:hypothetical protein
MHSVLLFWHFAAFGPPGANVHFLPGNEKNYKKCSACGHLITNQALGPVQLDIRGSGSKWPDILSATPYIIVQDRVARAIQENGLTGCIFHAVEITGIENRKLATLTPPSYFLIEITGKVDIDLNELDEIGGGVCPICFRRNAQSRPYQFVAKKTVPKLDTWDGSDFVTTRNLQSGMSYCTRRFVDLACKHRWTNFRFGSRDSMPGVGMWAKTAEGGISYYDPDWYDKVSRKVADRFPESFKTDEINVHKISTDMREETSRGDMGGDVLETMQEDSLAHPKWQEVEEHFKVTLPSILKDFYSNQSLSNIGRRIKSKKSIENDCSIYVDRLAPIHKGGIREVHSDEGDMLCIADDGGEGEYLFDPKEPDPEVILVFDFSDYYETGLSLQEFLKSLS